MRILRQCFQLKKNVSVAEAMDKLLAINVPLCSANSEMLERLIPFHGCHVYTKTTKVKITDKGLAINSLDINVIYAIGDCRQFKSAYRAVWCL